MVAKLKIVAATVVVLAGITALWICLDDGTETALPSLDEDTLAVVDPNNTATTASHGLSTTDEDRTIESDIAESLQGIQSIKGSGVPVYGRILDQDGNPLEGVTIAETSTDENVGIRLLEADWKDTGKKTGSDGSFSMEFPMHALPVTYLRFMHPDYREVQVPLIKTTPPAGLPSAKKTLPRMAPLGFRVADTTTFPGGGGTSTPSNV